MNALKVTLLTLTLATLLVGCGDDAPGDAGAGAISVRAYGESFIEEGIGAEELGDGWAISFSRFDVTFRDVSVGGAVLADPDAVSLHEPSAGEGHELGTVSVAAGTHASPSFTIADVVVEGAAELGDVSKTFSFSFATPTRYSRCETSTVVGTGETATFQLTVHADHLFYDSLVSEEPQLRFQPLADADADEDGAITTAELQAANLGAYDPGNEDIEDLWSFLVAQHRTLGHVDGEGHCEASVGD